MTAANANTTEGYSGLDAMAQRRSARWYLYPETEKDEPRNRAGKDGLGKIGYTTKVMVVPPPVQPPCEGAGRCEASAGGVVWSDRCSSTR